MEFRNMPDKDFGFFAKVRLIAALFLLFSLLMTAACSSGSGEGSSSGAYFKAVKRDLKICLPLHGVIESREKHEISSPYSGVIAYLRPEGDYVKKGELVAKLETTELKDELEQYMLDKRMIDIDFLSKGIDHEQKIIEKRNRMLFEQISKDRDFVVYRQMKYGLDYTKKIELEYELVNSDIEIKNLENELAEKKTLLGRGFISQTEINDLNQQIFAKKKARDSVRLNLDKLMKGIDVKELADKETELKIDSLSVELAVKSYEVTFGTRSMIKRGLKNRLNNVEKNIARTKTIIDSVSMTAPVEGIVIYGKTWITDGEREKVKMGISVWEGWSFMSVSSLNEMDVHFKINEVDMSKIKKGQKVLFYIAADPSKTLEAEIYDIANIAMVSESDANQVCSILVKAKIMADSKKMNFKPGMSVNAEITIDERRDILCVPRTAISSGGFVRLANGEKRKVVTGTSDLFDVEIKSGLEPGEVIFAHNGSYDTFKNADKSAEFYSVKKGEVSENISEIGELVAANKTNISIPFSGKINKIAPEGTFIKKDYEVALIDVKEKEDKLTEKELRAKVLEKERKIEEKRSRADILSLENNIKIKKIDLEILTLDYEILVMPLRKQKKKEFEIGIKLCENSLKGIENEFKSKSEMSKKGYISQNEINKINIRLNKARADLDVAAYKYDYEKSLPLPNNLAKAKMDLEKARLDYDLEKFKLECREKKMNYAIERKESEIKSNGMQLKEYKKVVDGASVKAPIAGSVIYVKKWSGDGMKKIKEGDITRENMTFLEIANLDSFFIKGSVPEEQFNKIRASMEVEFYLPADPVKKFKGRIKTIGLFAREREEENFFSSSKDDFPAEVPKFFDIEIETDVKNPKFQPGISVNFEIPVESRKGVVKIPRKYLFKDSSGDYVVMKNGNVRRVKCGVKSKEDVEIIDGLLEGDIIAY